MVYSLRLGQYSSEFTLINSVIHYNTCLAGGTNLVSPLIVNFDAKKWRGWVEVGGLRWVGDGVLHTEYLVI